MGEIAPSTRLFLKVAVTLPSHEVERVLGLATDDSDTLIEWQQPFETSFVADVQPIAPQA